MYANNDGNSQYFIPYLRLVTYTNILSVFASESVAKDVGLRPSNCIFFFNVFFFHYYYYSAISTFRAPDKKFW